MLAHIAFGPRFVNYGFIFGFFLSKIEDLYRFRSNLVWFSRKQRRIEIIVEVEERLEGRTESIRVDLRSR